MIKKFIKSLFVDNSIFYYLSAIVLLFILGYFIPACFIYGQIALLCLSALCAVDIFLLYKFSEPIKAERILGDKLSNGDDNVISVKLSNFYPFECRFEIIDELPFQFQKRDFKLSGKLEKNQTYFHSYTLRPVQRGEYRFGALNVFAQTKLRLFKKRFVFDFGRMVPVYPSFLQMRKYELLAISRNLSEAGIKKIRKVGNTIEFDHIRKYVQGDDYRSINWKATARKAELMANQFQDERAQNVYSLIDMGRTMKMPFNGMTLLDYSINAALALSSIALKKSDKPGLMTFNHEVSFFLKSDAKKDQIKKISEALYNQKTNFMEANYPAVYNQAKSCIKQRSLLLLFTNFETISGLRRHLDFLIALSKRHLLVVIFFKNTELDELLIADSVSLSDVYLKTIAEKTAFEKKLIAKELKKYGVLSVYTEPKNLTVDLINKYLEIKAKRLL